MWIYKARIISLLNIPRWRGKFLLPKVIVNGVDKNIPICVFQPNLTSIHVHRLYYSVFEHHQNVVL